MNNKVYIYIPILLSIIAEFFAPYFKTLYIDNVFLSPPYFFNSIMYTAKYILLGFLLYESREIGHNKIFIDAWILTFLNLAWGYYINRNNQYAIVFMFLSLLVSYFIYNEIFLSSLTNNENTLYLNLMTTYIIWITFMITLVFQYEQLFGKKRLKSNKKLIG
jgi:hypothetical protein